MFTLKDGAFLHGGSYRITRFLSAGGFGCTYEAVHIGLKRRVAIKEFFVSDFCNRDPETSRVYVSTQSKVELSEKLKRKFLDEASAVASLNHPGIVRVTDVFEENGTAYFVMDFIDGRGLDRLIADKGSLPEHEALQYIRQAADALAYVHGTKRLHLDIKPANIMIDGDGHAILIDFGVSKQYDEAAGENTSTLIGRTPGYAPIEQMSSKLRTFTPATDIYALGATLYKAVTGVTPPEATELHINEELLFPATLSARVVNAIEAATKLRAEDRPQSIAAFLSLLDAPASPNPAPVQPLSIENTVPVSAPAQAEQTPTQSHSVPAPDPDIYYEYDDPPKSKSKKYLIAAAAVAILAVVIFLLSSKDKEESYTGMPVGSTFSSGGLNYEVTAEGEVGIARNKDISGDVSIPSEVRYRSYTYYVTSITNSAFSSDSSLTSIFIPSSVTSIGRYAFSNCSRLASVNIPSSVTSIGDRAFYKCSSLTSVIIPPSVTYIEDCTFEWCLSLTSVIISSSVTSIGNEAFRYCYSLSSVDIENPDCKIAFDAFYNTRFADRTNAAYFH